MLKRLIKFFKNWAQQWARYFRMKEIDKITKKLSQSRLERIMDRVELKGEIIDFIKTKFKKNPSSDYIPPALRRQIVNEIYLNYRPRLEGCGLDISYTLQFSK